MGAGERRGDEESIMAEDEWSVESHMQLLRGEIDKDVEEDLSNQTALELPKWFDKDKFRRGQSFFNKNFMPLFVSKLCGLISVLLVPEISKILIMTNQSSEPKTAFKRYLATIAHMLLWYQGDVQDPTSWAYKSLKDVHSMHSAANRRGRKESMGCVSQSSLALTQFGFMGYGLLFPQKLGMDASDEKEVEGFVHFWRTIGFLLGIQDRYNICRDSLSETKALCEAILQDMYVPVLKNPFEDFTFLSTALLKGVWPIVPEIDVEAFSTYHKYLSGIEVETCSNWYSRMMFNLQIFIHESLLASKWFGRMWRSIMNGLMWFALVITMRYPLLAYYAFGVPLKPLNIRY